MRLDWQEKGFRAALEADTLSLMIYGPIGASGDEQEQEHVVRAAAVVQRLAEFAGGTIQVYINSPGGLVSEAMAMYTALTRHPARKLVQIDGVCASAATIIAMAGDRISAAEGTMLMVHAVSNTISGDAAQMRREADVLDKLTETLVNLYVRRTGRGRADVSRWVTEETWFTAQEALAAGLIDEVSAASRAVASWNLSAYGLTRPPGRLDGAGSIAELQREVRALRSEVARMNAAGGPVAAAVLSGLGETFHEWLEAFKGAALECLESDPALRDAAACFREDMAALAEESAASGAGGDDADELAGVSASGETELARLMARVKRGPGR